MELNEEITFDLHNVFTDSLTVEILKGNFIEKVKQFIAKDKAYSFIQPIKGNLAY